MESNTPFEDKPTVTAPPKAPKKSLAKNNLMWLLTIILVAGGAYGGFWWRDRDSKKEQKADQAKIQELNSKVQLLEGTAAADSTTAAAADEPADAAPAVVPTAKTKENVIASIETGNTAALEGYMAETVSVIIAASEGVGNRTPTQAVSDLTYLDSATDPWDFSLPAATLTDYQTGDYKSYFKSNSVVGKSTNGYVVSFNFNSSGKINGVFMVVNEDLL